GRAEQVPPARGAVALCGVPPANAQRRPPRGPVPADADLRRARAGLRRPAGAAGGRGALVPAGQHGGEVVPWGEHGAPQPADDALRRRRRVLRSGAVAPSAGGPTFFGTRVRFRAGVVIGGGRGPGGGGGGAPPRGRP